MSSTGRIIYYGGRGAAKPSGGYAVLLQHVRWLRAAGFDSYLLVEPNFVPGYEPPSDGVRLLRTDAELNADDIIIFPEPDLRPISRLRQSARVWICCQGYQNIFNTTESPNAWSAMGVEGVLVTSNYLAHFVSRHFPELRLGLVPCAIEDFFTPAPAAKKTRER